MFYIFASEQIAASTTKWYQSLESNGGFDAKAAICLYTHTVLAGDCGGTKRGG